jgi:hypothetical protein
MRLSRSLVLPAALIVGLTANALAQDANSAGGKRVVPTVPSNPKARPAAPDFGTLGEHYVRVGGSEFIPDSLAGGPYDNSFNGGNTRWAGWIRTAGVFDHVYGWVHAPGGSLVDYIELDYCNNDPTAGHDLIMNVWDCGFEGDCGASPLLTLTGAANSGCSDASGNPGSFTPDNFLHEYLLDVIFPAAGLHDGSIALAGAIVGWKYQVSPAPGSATFPDVPSSDFGFQYIEALAASGITGGCGGGNYCPDSNLTRRQMAIFLSKALGLYWGGM